MLIGNITMLIVHLRVNRITIFTIDILIPLCYNITLEGCCVKTDEHIKLFC